MVGTRDVPRFIAINHIKAGQEQAFETFIRDVVVPAVRQARPHLADQWQTLRPSEEQPADSSWRTYIVLFYGERPLDDWDLAPMLKEVHGEDEGARLDEQFADFYETDQVVYAVSGEL
jgi:hypothetical protein